MTILILWLFCFFANMVLSKCAYENELLITTHMLTIPIMTMTMVDGNDNNGGPERDPIPNSHK